MSYIDLYFQLKQRLDRMERRMTVPQNNKNNSHLHNSNNSFSLDSFSDNMTHDTGFCADTEDSKDNLTVMGLCGEESEFNPVVPTIECRSADRGNQETEIDSMGPSDRCFTNRRNKISNILFNNLYVAVYFFSNIQNTMLYFNLAIYFYILILKQKV